MNALALAALLAASGIWAQEEGTSAHPNILMPGGLFLLHFSEAPLSFMTLTPGELPAGAVDIGEVRGQACQHGLSLPISLSLRGTSVSGAAGNGGYRKALEAIRKTKPELAGVYDVKVDVHTIGIFGFYRRTCIEILGRGFRLRRG